MQKHIFIAAKDIRKAKTLALIEPFYPCGQQRQGRKFRHSRLGIFFAQGKQARRGRCNFFDRDGLNAPLGHLDAHHDRGTICNRALSEIAQNIGMQEDICTPFIRNDETKSLGGIEPFYVAMHDMRGLFFVFHVASHFPRTSPNCSLAAF